ncbi:hypothetical protein LCGC14_0391380 [marine sediment metagenome]|uniref:Uncharacterized protein n=1 Tax=marine sediment metagenome TaxID=412755 RepID=A0A0F9THG9_9ZZZZ
MPELIIAFALGLLLPSIAVYLVDRRRRGAWVAEGASRGREEVQGEAAVQQATAVAVETERLVSEYTEAIQALVRGHGEATEALEAEHEQAREAGRQVVEALQNTLLLARGEIEGLNAAHAEAKDWADKILRDHEWHIGGKEAVHGRDPRVQYSCAHCKAVIYAEEGAL